MAEKVIRASARLIGRYTDILFARPSLIEGAARLVDFSGTLSTYNQSESPQEADYKALWADWCQVGAELGEEMNQYARTH